MMNRHDDIDMIKRCDDTDYTTLRLYPVCECGYVFYDLRCRKDILTAKGRCRFSSPCFNPPRCPVCHKKIGSIMYKDFDVLFRDNNDVDLSY